jgi:WD40 repeat protein
MKPICSILIFFLFLSACSSSIPSATSTPFTQPTLTNVSVPTKIPPSGVPAPTTTSTPTLALTLESLLALLPITADNAHQLELLRTLPIPGYKPSSVSQCSLDFSPDGALLAGVCDYSTIPVWDVLSGKLKYTFLDEASHEVSIVFDPTGEVLAVGGFSGEIRLFDVLTGKALPGYATVPSQVWDLAFSPTGDQLAASTFSTGAFLFEYPGGEQIWSNGERGRVSVLSVAFSSDGSQVALGRITSGLMILAQKDGSKITELHIPAPVGDVAYSPDGQWLASGSDDNKIRLWAAADYSLANTLIGHSGFVNGVAFSPDSSLLISGSHDHKIGVWDVSRAMRLIFLEGHENTVLRLDFNPSGTLIASISWDGTVRLWGVKDN